MAKARPGARTDRPSWRALLDQAEAHLAAGRSRAARALLTKSLELNPDQPTACRQLSDLAMAAGDLQAALAARARSGDTQGLARVTRIRALLGSKTFGEALDELEALLAADATDGLA